ncbi:translocation/assembly module TamB domain-containing protein [Massilia sp. TS11]|uniref:translocation/assembly module TamB domain-containing protein n=1 Tax=Massilia sp. TS11 TaxID=2908003 RepID=UPI001ED9FAF7|nr:translocation/assembly module TamB domain-containing protein [Massilia sp. TS11]MCG2585035.1 translocation/assembly module TamB domain-containing protein [Massilia sp. TS11]
MKTPLPPWIRRSAIAAGALAVLAGGAWWYLGRESTLQALVQKLADASGGQVAAEGVSGSLFGRMQVEKLVFRDEFHDVSVRGIELRWSPWQLFTSGIAISQLQARSLRIATLKDSGPAKLPLSLAPPFSLSIGAASIETLEVQGQRLQRLRFGLSGDSANWTLRGASVQTPYGELRASGQIGAQAPFSVDARADLAAAPLAVQLQAKGPLATLDVQATARAGSSSAQGAARVTPFAPQPLASLTLTAKGFDLQQLAANLPATRLDLNLQLAGTSAVSGQLQLANADPARAIDQRGLPFKRLAAALQGNWQTLALQDLQLDLGSAGRASGSGTLSLQPAPAADLSVQTEGLNLAAIHTRLHATSIGGRIALRANAQEQALTARLAQSGLLLDASLRHAAGALHLDSLQLKAGGGSLTASGSADLQGTTPFRLQASSSHFNPAALGRYPQADLNLSAEAKGQLGADPNAQAALRIGPSKLLGQNLSGEASFSVQAGRLSNAAAAIALGPNSLKLQGALGGRGDELRWQLDGRQLGALQPGLGGSVQISGVASGELRAPRTSFTLEASGLAWGSGAQATNSRVQASGEAWVEQAALAFNLKGSSSHLSPAAFGPWLAGDINAGFDARGRLGASWQTSASLRLEPSTLLNTPLAGTANLSASAQHLEQADLDLRLGTARLNLRGAFGRAGEQLALKLDAPALAMLGPNFAGALHADATLGGSIDAPALQATVQGERLKLFGQHQLRQLKASTSLASGRGADDPLSTDVELADYVGPALSLSSARLSTRGTRGAHTVQLRARGEALDASAELRGALAQNRWDGQLAALENSGRFALRLRQPAPLQLAWSSGLQLEQLAIREAVLALPTGSLTLNSFDKSGHRWRSSGHADGVSLNYLGQLVPAIHETLSGDLQLGARWQLDVQAEPGAAPAIDGSVAVLRERGDATVGADVPVVLGLRQLEARAEVRDGVLRLVADADSARGGRLHFDGGAELQQGRLSNASPLTLNASGDLRSIAWLAPASGEPGLELDGTLQFAFSGGGTLGTPALNGNLRGDKLAVRWTDQGLKLRDGVLAARINGDELLLERLQFQGPQGSLAVDGKARLLDGDLQLNLRASAQQLELLSRPDRTVVVSGQANLLRDAHRYQLEGKLRADRALVELAPQDRPTLSDDVIVLGARGPVSKPAPSGRALGVELDLSLGDEFRLKGMGLDAQLAGSVHLHMAERQRPRLNGSIRVASGTYFAYGQKLQIERGVLNFSGAYDNPALSILAVRKRPEGEQLSETNVEAGVEVRGSALAPSAKLVSTPNVSDSDKLSWLVLGHGIDVAAGQEYGVLSAAAGALLGGANGMGLQGKLAGAIGVDEVGLSQAKGLETTVVTVGKRLSQRAYLSFEQGASAASSLVKLRYKLNPRVTVQLQTGANSALDVLYSWAFD